MCLYFCLSYPARSWNFLRHIVLSSVVCLAVSYFSTLSHERNDFRIKIIEHEMCFDFLGNFGLQHISF